jgi:hypothetical protein
MLKFFRRIRQNLIAEGKISRYFKYAIGEILLVVIGILIALQINNANEKRKARLQEVIILQNLKEDINLDTLDISYNLEGYGRILNAEIQLFNFLKSDLTTPKDSIDYSLALGYPLVVALHDATFKNLQNNNIGLITNNELKKDISRFYDFFIDGIELIENKVSVYDTYTSKKVFFQKYFKVVDGLFLVGNDQSKNEDYYNPDLIKLPIDIVDIINAKNDEAFIMELNESIFIRNVKIEFYNNIVLKIKALNIAIDEELGLLKR